jgi:hypothetical protein
MSDIPLCPTCGNIPSHRGLCLVDLSLCPDPIHSLADRGPQLLQERDEARELVWQFMVQIEHAGLSRKWTINCSCPGCAAITRWRSEGWKPKEERLTNEEREESERERPRVTREMALDAGDPNLEGTPY